MRSKNMDVNFFKIFDQNVLCLKEILINFKNFQSDDSRILMEFFKKLVGNFDSKYTQYGPITNVGIFPGLGVLYFYPDFQG